MRNLSKTILGAACAVLALALPATASAQWVVPPLPDLDAAPIAPEIPAQLPQQSPTPPPATPTPTPTPAEPVQAVATTAKLERKTLRLRFACTAPGKATVSYRGKRTGAALFACSEGQARANVKLSRKAARRLRRGENAPVKLTITTAAGKSSQTVRLRHGVTAQQASAAAAWWTYFHRVPQSPYTNSGVHFGWFWDVFARWDDEYGAGFIVAAHVMCDVTPGPGYEPTGECWQNQLFKVWLFDSNGQLYGPYGPFVRYFDWNQRWG